MEFFGLQKKTSTEDVNTRICTNYVFIMLESNRATNRYPPLKTSTEDVNRNEFPDANASVSDLQGIAGMR